MKIKQILKYLKKLKITGISDDTRYLSEGDLFICHYGNHYKGNDFINAAIQKGAKAILSDEDIPNCPVPVIKVPNPKEIMYPLVASFYKYPWKKMRLIGITGTDGKTTTATIIEYLLSQKYKVAYIGTNGIRYLNKSIKTSYTTLPYCLFIRTLYNLKEEKIKYVCLEASSQGLVNNRLYNIKFDVAIFTNLSHEHLDTHKTMENYFEAKLQLFKQLKKRGVAIVNNDSPYASRINYNNITYSINNTANYQAANIDFSLEYSNFDLIINNKIFKKLQVNFHETYNIYNLLAAIIVANYYKIPIKKIKSRLTTIPKIDGRLELIFSNETFKVFIDFAHTPNALKEVLSNLRTKTTARIIAVCGSAGNKDKSKRPLMGVIATTYADHVVFTSEDPRTENPLNIINEIVSNVQTNNYEIIIKREEAIYKAITMAKNNDIIIVTGKGNDDYFEINNQKLQYSDSLVIKEILNKLN